MTIQETVTTAFVDTFGSQPDIVVRAPGRVNLIGEHTDYNDGFVLPMAINRAVYIALRPTDDTTVAIQSLDFDDDIRFSLDDFDKSDETTPAEYVKGVAWAMQDTGHELRGFEGIMKGDVPVGAGLSSSAAVELAVARAFATVSDLSWDAATIAKLCQRAENQWVGVNSGIMDQMISAAGRAGHALLIDCRSLETEFYPLPDDTAVIVLDTGTRRELSGSAYNERRQQCETAAAHFGADALRDVNVEQFETGADALDDLVMRRARHVITENARVQKAVQTMQDGNAKGLGALLNDSHASLRDDFEVSSDALNAIVEAAQAHPACYGARMTGAGFGGCAVALVDADQADGFEVFVTERYSERTAHTPRIYVCTATDGAGIVSSS